MTATDKSGTLQMVGGIKTDVSPPGDDSFYDNLFARMPVEVSHTGELTRYVAFDYLTEDKNPITFFGIEVDRIENIPEGMIAWDLNAQSLTVIKAGIHESVIIWKEDVKWHWRDESPYDCKRGMMGEFSVRVPLKWGAGEGSDYRYFSMTANMYVMPGKKGADDGIYLVDYDSKWIEAFNEFSQWLYEFMGPDLALRIEHIGSTSIPGMTAKPVIDILVQVPSILKAKEILLPRLNQPTWEYFWYHNHITLVKRDKFMGMRTHHVHLMEEGHDFNQRLAFRDYLKAHNDEAQRYAALKRNLSERHQSNREKYTESKTSFVNEILEKALPSVF